MIIAVVLGALFQLGVFNASTLAPRAPPGACQVFRPNGPLSASFINTEGVCNGELPQYVANFNGGSSTAITIGAPASPSATAMTVSAWVSPAAYLGGRMKIVGNNCCGGNNDFYLDAYGNGAGSAEFYVADSGWINTDSPPSLFSTNAWIFVTGRYNGSYISVWINGVQENSRATSGSLPLPIGGIGIGGANGDSPFTGSIANVQMYNASLSENEIQALYQEGIGGAPITLQSLVAWWPLNGNANDYSGNNNNGAPSGVTYTSQWTNGYVPP